MQPTYIQIGFTQLFPSSTAAVAATVGVGTRGCHLVAGGHISLLQEKDKRKNGRSLWTKTQQKQITFKIYNLNKRRTHAAGVVFTKDAELRGEQ